MAYYYDLIAWNTCYSWAILMGCLIKSLKFNASASAHHQIYQNLCPEVKGLATIGDCCTKSRLAECNGSTKHHGKSADRVTNLSHNGLDNLESELRNWAWCGDLP